MISQKSVRVAALPCSALLMRRQEVEGWPPRLFVLLGRESLQQREASGWASPGQQPRCSSLAFLVTSLPLEPELQITGWGF